MRNVSQETIKAYPLSLPPISEQKLIADVLDRAEALRTKRRAALGLLGTLTQAIFLEMFGDPKSQSRGKSVVLSDCAEIVSGVAKGRKFSGRTTKQVPYLRVANVQAGYLDLDEIKTIEALPSEIEELRLMPGDVVLTEGGDHDKLGRGAMWEGQVEDCIHQNHIFRVRTDRTILLPRFFHEYLQTHAARSYFLRCAKKTTNLASINMTQLRAFPLLVLPPVSRQREFLERAEAVVRTKAVSLASLAQLDELFASLQDRAFRGAL